LGVWAKRDGRKVYAFEPVSYLYKLSKKNIELNNLEDFVVLKKAALSNEDGATDIYVESIRSSIVPYTKGHFDHNKIEKVPTVKLDNYFLNYSNEKIGLIFLDVEGYELYALQGALGIIKRDRPYLILEISPKILEKISLTENDMFNFLNEQKYFTYVINDNYRAQGIESSQMIKERLLVDLKNYFQGREKTGDYYNVLASPIDFELNDYV
jgi:FkbM family methyltransferase